MIVVAKGGPPQIEQADASESVCYERTMNGSCSIQVYPGTGFELGNSHTATVAAAIAQMLGARDHFGC